MGNYRTIIRLMTLLTIIIMGCNDIRAYNGSERDIVDSIKKNLSNIRYQTQKDSIYKYKKILEKEKDKIEKGLKKYPDNAELNYFYGLYYFYAGKKIENARYRFVRTLQINDQHAKARYMLMMIEDSLKNYSSAICYINELLEQQPYDRDLWERKIALNRKLGNHAEAEDIRMRLAHIYNNDDSLRLYRENRWNRILKKSDLAVEADNLELEIRNLEASKKNREKPKEYTYYNKYKDLADLYSTLGEHDKAIETALRGLVNVDNLTKEERYTLTRKAARLMVNLGRYSQAQDFVTDKYGYYGASREFLDSVMILIAEDTRMHDTYEANARLYEKRKDNETLIYLLNNSIARCYYDDAMYYIKVGRKKKLYGDSTEFVLQKKRYILETRMGNKLAAQNALRNLYHLKKPDDKSLRDEYIDAFYQLSNNDIANSQWNDALTDLEELYSLIEHSPQHEFWPSMMTRRITTFGHLGQYKEAYQTYLTAKDSLPTDSNLFASAYEEIIVNHLRNYIEEERYDSALQISMQLLNDVPSSNIALRNCINLSQTLKRDSLFSKYAEEGFKNNQKTPYFTIKYATALARNKQYKEALDTLDLYYKDGTNITPSIINTYSQVTLDFINDTTEQAKRIKGNVKELINRALKYDPSNKELLYYRGVVYERYHEWDSAHFYQRRYYEPGNAEQREYYQHIDYLQFRSFKERIDLSYTHALYDTRQDDLASTGHLYSIASVAYTHLADTANTYTVQVSYKGIDGYHYGKKSESGGAGIELTGQWEHRLSDRWTGTISGSWSSQYFNKWGANASVSLAANHGWTPTLRIGYRRTPETYLYLSSTSRQDVESKKYHLFIVSPSVEKSWSEERIKTTLTTDVTTLKGSIYYNVGLKGKLFFNDDNISSVSLLTGFGSFPELSFFEQTALRNVSHTNSMVGFDAQILCSSRLYIGLSGTWNTCYDPYWNANGILEDSYRNIYSITAQLHVAF